MNTIDDIHISLGLGQDGVLSNVTSESDSFVSIDLYSTITEYGKCP